jgi:hypothetical protein
MRRFRLSGSGIARRLSILLFGAVFWVPALPASTIIFATGPQTVGGREINATAAFDFNFTAQTVTISLLNLELNPTDISQTLGSLRFDLAGAGANPALLFQSSSLGTFDIDNLGRPKADIKPNAWTTSNIGGTTIGFCAVCASGGVGMPGLIIGGPNASLRYSNDDGTLKNRSKPEAFVIGSGDTYSSGALAALDTTPTWIYQITTLTPAAMVSNVRFGFGEGAAWGSDEYFMAAYSEFDVPEADSAILLGTGLVLVIAAASLRARLRRRS